MSEHIIQNPVPTPEEMADLLGISRDRVTVIRNIMRSPSRTKVAWHEGKAFAAKKSAAKESSATKTLRAGSGKGLRGKTEAR